MSDLIVWSEIPWLVLLVRRSAVIATAAKVALAGTTFTLAHCGVGVVACARAVVLAGDTSRAAHSTRVAVASASAAAAAGAMSTRRILVHIFILKVKGDGAVRTASVVAAAVTSAVVSQGIVAVIAVVVVMVVASVVAEVPTARVLHVEGVTCKCCHSWSGGDSYRGNSCHRCHDFPS